MGWAFSYSTATAGTAVTLASPGLPVVLEWSCMNAGQLYSSTYCSWFWPFDGCADYDDYHVYHDFASASAGSQSVGSDFSTGGALFGSVTLDPGPLVTTTYTLSCKGYRHYYATGDLASCSGGTTVCNIPNYQRGTVDANASYQGLPITVTVTPPPNIPPDVVTGTANPITTSSATLNGTGNPNWFATTGWFRYSTTDPVTCNDSFGNKVPSVNANLGSGNSPVAYSHPLSGLPENTTYYYCALASNAYGTAVGGVVQFATLNSDVCNNISGPQGTPPTNGYASGGDCFCNSGYTLQGDQCVLTPTISSFLATPPRVRKGTPSMLNWTVTNPPLAGCSITGTDGFNTTVNPVDGVPGSIATNAINQRTVFTLSCGTAPLSQATVTIVPTVIEI